MFHQLGNKSFQNITYLAHHSKLMSVYFRHVHSSFEDVRVDLGHAVDSMRTHNAQMSHVDPLLSALLNERHAAQTIIITRILRSNSLQR